MSFDNLMLHLAAPRFDDQSSRHDRLPMIRSRANMHPALVRSNASDVACDGNQYGRNMVIELHRCSGIDH